MELSTRPIGVSEERNQGVGELANFGCRVVTVSGSGQKLRNHRQVRPNSIVTDWFPMMTDRCVKRMWQRLEPIGEQWQLNSGLASAAGFVANSSSARRLASSRPATGWRRTPNRASQT